METPQTEAQKAKAARAQTILYLVMGLMVILPFIVMWLKGRK